MKNILERPKHAAFLDKVRNCAPTFSSPATTALTASSGQIMPSEALTDALIASKPPQIKRKDYSLLSSGLSLSVLVGDLDFSCGRTDEGTLRGPCGPKNGQKTTSFLYLPQVVQSRQDGMNQGFA